VKIYFVFSKNKIIFRHNGGQKRRYSPNTGHILYLISWFWHAADHYESLILTYVQPNSDLVHTLYHNILYIKEYTREIH